MGDTSALAETLEKTKRDTYQYNGEDPDDTSMIHSKNVGEFLQIGEEYNYIFKNGKWYVYDGDSLENEEVTPNLIALND